MSAALFSCPLSSFTLIFGAGYSWEREANMLHPSQKPLGAISRLLKAYSREGDLVLDPFMGSGTTLVAARNLGRRAIGIDIEQKYCEAARLRLAQRILRFSEPTRASLEVV
jgi:DNA modification methylase